MITAGIILLVAVIIILGSNFLVNYSLCPRKYTTEEGEKYVRERFETINPWMDRIQSSGELKDTFIVAPDGVKLHAFYAKSAIPTKKTAVIVHGYTDQALTMFHIAYLYHNDLNFNILVPDLRYAGLSGGDAIQMGWKDRLDVEQWIEKAPELFGEDLNIVVHGISMGAATTMMLSGDKLPENVKCFVEDCGYTSAWDQFAKELKGRFYLPSFPLLNLADCICNHRYGWSFKEASSVNQVAKCSLPMYFIHGDEDDYVPTWMVYEVYKSKPEPKEIWITEGVGHARSYDIYPEEYTRRVKEFTDKYLED